MPRTPFPAITIDTLNRTTLDRQLLIEPSDLDLIAAMERIGGLQAQEPASPYLALSARLASFDPAALDDAFSTREAIKATLMRVTLHAVSREDYRHLLPAVLPMLRSVRRSDLEEHGGDLEMLGQRAIAFAAVPRGNAEIRDHVASASGVDAQAAWWRIRRQVPFVHVPTADPWSFGRRPTLIDGRLWLGGPFAEPDDAIRHLLVRYLGAFGPATLPDAAQWSGLAIATLRRGVALLDAEGALQRYSDPVGRELIDLADARIVDGELPVPPRLLPMWDSLLLAHADRSRVIAAPWRPVVIAKNGDVLPTFLVDGRVAGLWWPERDGSRSRVVLEPFGALARDARAELEALGETLATLVEDREPMVYDRYRRSRARR